MRIAIPIDHLDPHRGGLERYVSEIARNLALRGHEVHIPCLSGSLPNEGVTVHRIRIAPGPRVLARFGRACLSWIGEMKPDASLGVGRSLGTDIYQAHGGLHGTSRTALREAERSPLRAAARRAGGALRWKDRLLQRLERAQILHGATRVVVALSERSRSEIAAAYPGVEDRMRVIPIGVDLDRFPTGSPEGADGDLRRRWGIPAGRRIALFVGHHFLLKGLGPALEAIARIPRETMPHLVVIGGARADPFRRRARALGIDPVVTFAGTLPGIEGVLRGADLVIQPTFHDPCSHVTLEAWAAGLPVVTTPRNGAAELGRGSPALAIVEDPWDVEGLAREIVEMLAPERRTDRSGAALRIARDHSLERHVDEMEGLFREVCARGMREGASTR